MTLGGLALAVGILVDDATMELENIHRNLAQGKSLIRAILDGAQQIATPAFVSTLAICIVFVPVVFLTGAVRSLFTPLALAVVVAMLASYMLSRTLVPTLVRYLLQREVHLYQHTDGDHTAASQSCLWRLHLRFNRRFERLRTQYRRALAWALWHRRIVVGLAAAFVVASLVLVLFIGQDFFPQVDAGQFRLHVRAPAGTRIERTERLFSQVEDVIRRTVPAQELSLVLDNIGLPVGGINLAFSDNATVGAADGEILVALNPHQHGSTWQYVKQLRQRLSAQLPQLTFFFQPGDIVSQILNFGLPAPVDIQVVGRNLQDNYAVARHIAARVARIPGAVDVHVHQVMDAPQLFVNVDRTRAGQLGLTQRDVANNLLVSLSSSGQIAPNYWLNPQNGVNYLVAVQTPQYKVDSIDALQSTAIAVGGQSAPQLLSNLATVQRRSEMAVVNHYNVQPVFDITEA
jgi:multidrug efflux pump subunit AcrB